MTGTCNWGHCQPSKDIFNKEEVRICIDHIVELSATFEEFIPSIACMKKDFNKMSSMFYILYSKDSYPIGATLLSLIQVPST